MLTCTIANVLAVTTLIVGYTALRQDQRSARPLGQYIVGLLSDPDLTVLTQALPAEVAVYLPSDVTYRPQAARVLLVQDIEDAVDPGKSRFIDDELPHPIIQQQQLRLTDRQSNRRWMLWELHVDTSKSDIADSR